MRTWIFAAVMLATMPAWATGSDVFDANCAVCHQGGGVGVPGQFPRLAGRLGTIAAKPPGKAFLPQVLLNGMSGRITVDGEQILGVMPAFDSLSDNDLAQVLTYLSGLDHAPISFTPAEIAAARAQPRIASGAVAAEHARLAAKKIVP